MSPLSPSSEVGAPPPQQPPPTDSFPKESSLPTARLHAPSVRALRRTPGLAAGGGADLAVCGCRGGAAGGADDADEDAEFVYAIYPGQVALPGGKASSPSESPQTTSLREAHEEIGLPTSYPLTPLCQLPLSLAKTLLGVRPCVFLIPPTQTATDTLSTIRSWRADPDEVAAVFDAPLRGFLDGMRQEGGHYDGSWARQNVEWRLHNFYVPVSSSTTTAYYKVWGMTARILVDAARIAYGIDPEFEHDAGFGDEALIARLMAEEKLGPRESAQDDNKGTAAKL